MVINKAREASYTVAKNITKTKQPHTIGKSLFLPCWEES